MSALFALNAEVAVDAVSVLVVVLPLPLFDPVLSPATLPAQPVIPFHAVLPLAAPDAAAPTPLRSPAIDCKSCSSAVLRLTVPPVPVVLLVVVPLDATVLEVSLLVDVPMLVDVAALLDVAALSADDTAPPRLEMSDCRSLNRLPTLLAEPASSSD